MYDSHQQKSLMAIDSNILKYVYIVLFIFKNASKNMVVVTFLQLPVIIKRSSIQYQISIKNIFFSACEMNECVSSKQIGDYIRNLSQFCSYTPVRFIK